MPVRDKDTLVHEYPLSKKGINLNKNIVELDPEECLLAKNIVWSSGMRKRNGQDIFETDEVVASKKIVGLHRFYYSTASKVLVATAGTILKEHDGATWQNIRTGLTDSTQMHFSTWGGVQKMYYSNGVDGSLYSWDGTTDTALSGGNLPAKVIMTLPYQDRLLAIDNTNPGTLTWSASYDDTEADWEAASTTGVKPDTQLFGMINHSINNSDSGYESAVLLAGANSMYLFSGTDLRTPSTLGDYVIYPLATKVGCNAPRTMVWTPAGSIYLGIDGQVYILPFKASTPVPISDKLLSNQDEEGLESIPVGQIQNACAVYHKGYYILSITKSGGSTNTNQWWLDVSRLQQDEVGHWGPWYGPMVGQSISCFTVQSGPGDGGELMAGENSAKGFVYECNKVGITSDYDAANTTTKDIDVEWKTSHNSLGVPYLNKDVHEMEFELLNMTGTVNVDFHDITGSVKTGDSFQLTGGAVTWGDFNWGAENWANQSPTRQKLNISPALQSRRLAVILKFSSSTDRFELYSQRIKATEQNVVFG